MRGPDSQSRGTKVGTEYGIPDKSIPGTEPGLSRSMFGRKIDLPDLSEIQKKIDLTYLTWPYLILSNFTWAYLTT